MPGCALACGGELGRRRKAAALLKSASIAALLMHRSVTEADEPCLPKVLARDDAGRTRPGGADRARQPGLAAIRLRRAAAELRFSNRARARARSPICAAKPSSSTFGRAGATSAPAELGEFVQPATDLRQSSPSSRSRPRVPTSRPASCARSNIDAAVGRGSRRDRFTTSTRSPTIPVTLVAGRRRRTSPTSRSAG